MILSQAVLNTGRPIAISGIGLIKSPKLADIFLDENGEQKNFFLYNAAMKTVFSTKKEIIEFAKQLGDNSYDNLAQNEKDNATKYDLITYSWEFARLVAESFSLFFEGILGYAPEVGFIFIKKGEENYSQIITSANYSKLENLIKQCVHAKVEEEEEELTFASERARQIWEDIQAAKKKQGNTDVNSEDYEIGNIISKLSACGIGYNMENIYNLTVYQLLDQFSAYTQNRISRVAENSYSHWGGEHFDASGWFRKN